jgi:hypothetical protein
VSHGRLTFAVVSAALLGCGAVALTTSDALVRTLSLVNCGILVVAVLVVGRKVLRELR